MEFLVQVSITADSLEQAEAARDEIANGLQDGQDSGATADTRHSVGDVERVDGDRHTALIELARSKYAVPSGDAIEVDDNARTSTGDDGVFVQAWVWLPNSALQASGVPEVGASDEG